MNQIIFLIKSNVMNFNECIIFLNYVNLNHNKNIKNANDQNLFNFVEAQKNVLW